MGQTTVTTGSPAFHSLLSPGGQEEEMGEEPKDQSFASDLNLDQVAMAVAGDREEQDLLLALFYRQLHDPATIAFRHEIFQDLDEAALRLRLKESIRLLARVRSHLTQLEAMRSKQQREGWFLDAIVGYCEAVRSLREDLRTAPIRSRGLVSFRRFLDTYATSPAFHALVAETTEQKEALARLRYCVRIRGGHVDVSRYEDEPDYSAEVLKTFERFKQSEAKDYRIAYRGWPTMNHVGAQILDLVARLFSEEFSALEAYCQRHGDFFDPTVRRFEREVQFYLTYLDYITPLREAGLPFCYPEVASSKHVYANQTFDLPLARRLVAQAKAVVPNDFQLSGHERIMVISGPNQGGKTTFARTFGQLHHLASVGYPVPGTAARLFLFDRLFTHFERQEDLARMRGKLEDDLVRIRQVLTAASSESILVMNEIFSSTTLNDARFLGTKLLNKVIDLDMLAVYVTFVDELASLAPSIVSMVSTIVPEDPAQRTFKVLRRPADGLAYALAIAEKYGLSYPRLRERVRR